VILIKIAI